MNHLCHACGFLVNPRATQLEPCPACGSRLYVESELSPWIQTHTGAKYDLLDPDPATIRLHDVAHALANIGRYTGHTRRFYSVAEHSVRCFLAAPPELALEALFHDAHEIVTNDVASPIKRCLGRAWRAFEERHRLAFAVRFGLPLTPSPGVKEIDMRMLVTEARDLMTHPPQTWGVAYEPYPEPIVAHFDPSYWAAAFAGYARSLGVAP